MPEIKSQVSPSLYYRKMGTGPAIVLLHGFPESSDLWRYIWDDLSKKFTLIIPDFPGSGESELAGETSIAQMADCVAEILDHEQIAKAVIAGHSMGGYVAFAFAAAYPQRTAGLSVIHSIPTADDEEKKKNRQKTIDLIENGGKSAFVKQMIPNLFADSFKQNHPEILQEQISLAMENDEKSLVNFTRAMMNREDQSFWLENTSIPIQWIIGMEDNIIYHKKILEQSTKSGINFVTFYDGCGHMSMLEMPFKLIGDLEEFANYCNENKV